MTARLWKNAFARVYQNDGEFRGRSASHHVARVLLVARCVSNDELAARCGEIAISNVDGDALLAFGAQAVSEEREIDYACVAAGGGFGDGLELVVVNAARIVEEPADESGFAVVDTSGSGEAQKVFTFFAFEEGGKCLAGVEECGGHLEIALLFLNFHRAVLIVIDDAVLAFGAPHGDKFLDDFGNGVGVGTNSASARAATERAHAAHDKFGFLAGHAGNEGLFDGQKRVAAFEHQAGLGEIKRDDGDVFGMDVLPHIELCPIRERENAQAFAGVNAGVKDVPKFGALIARVPLATLIAKGKDTLFGAGAFFVAARATDSSIETAVAQAIEQRRCFECATTALGAPIKGICPFV